MFTVSFLREGVAKFRGWLDDLLATSWSACQGCDLLIESPSTMAGCHIAEALQVPYFKAFTMRESADSGVLPLADHVYLSSLDPDKGVSACFCCSGSPHGRQLQLYGERANLRDPLLALLTHFLQTYTIVSVSDICRPTPLSYVCSLIRFSGGR